MRIKMTANEMYEIFQNFIKNDHNHLRATVDNLVKKLYIGIGIVATLQVALGVLLVILK